MAFSWIGAVPMPSSAATSSSRLSSSLTSFGLALPPLPFITWPTRKPNVCCLPARYCATASALRADDVADDREQRAFVADLRQPFGGDDLVGRPARVVHLREDVLARSSC